MPTETDFLYNKTAALAGLFVTLVSNKDGVTKYLAAQSSTPSGQWTISPKPPAGTYALYAGVSAGAITTLVDPNYVVDPMQDDGSAIFPGNVTVNGQLAVNRPANLQAGQVGAVASVVSLTTPNDGAKHVFRVAVFINITVHGTEVIYPRVTYTDDTGVVQTVALTIVSAVTGYAGDSTMFEGGPWTGDIFILANPNTQITLFTAGTFAGVTYNVGGVIDQVA